MLNVINAEWIKLRSTKALWWTTALILFFSIAFGALAGFGNGSTLANANLPADLKAEIVQSLNPGFALNGFLLFGLMIIIIQSVLLVTSEYGHGTQKTSVMATPQRWKLPIAKFLVYGIIAAIIAVVTSLISILVTQWVFSLSVDDPELVSMLGLSADHAWEYVGRAVLYAVLVVMLSIGVSYIIRHTAGAIAALLLWKLVIELAVVPMIPKVRDHLPQWMPFGNMDSYSMLMDHPDVPWADSLGQTGSMLYFALWCVVLFIVGIVALQKRDA